MCGIFEILVGVMCMGPGGGCLGGCWGDYGVYTYSNMDLVLYLVNNFGLLGFSGGWVRRYGEAGFSFICTCVLL